MSVLVLSGCAGYAPNFNLLASGPSPVLDATVQQAAADNQQQVVIQISRMAGLGPREPATPAEWQAFVVAAMTRGRIECNAYLTEIMKLEEHRRTVNSQLGLFGAATAGILGLSGAASQAIAITAIAFGLAQGTVDNITTGLLYSLGAEPVSALITNLRAAYIQGLNQSSWQDRASAFATIYGYLELCTPVVLREKIKTAVTVATPAATDASPLGAPHVTLIPSARTPIVVPPAPPRQPLTDPRERGVTSAMIRDIQQTLCVAVDGDAGGLPGSKTSNTRRAIREFQSALGSGDPDTANDLLTSSRLSQAADLARDASGSVTTCKARGLETAFELGAFGMGDAAAQRRQVLLYQGQINKKLPADKQITLDGNLTTLHAAVGALRNDGRTSIDHAFFVELFK
ncbi:MAG: hypothetical protein JSS04_15315 [Proteobacteria bacterium]|nr:hypothetical protein [Pseudomonadota bacterium]